MNHKEMLEKQSEVEPSEAERLLAPESDSLTINRRKDIRRKELSEASALLAETTRASAELLAETTRISADLLAKTTQLSAEQLRKSNEISVRQMKWLTVTMLAIGFIQVVIAITALLINLLQLK